MTSMTVIAGIWSKYIAYLWSYCYSCNIDYFYIIFQFRICIKRTNKLTEHRYLVDLIKFWVVFFFKQKLLETLSVLFWKTKKNMSKSSSKFSFNIDDILCHTTSTASVSVPTVSSYTNSTTTEFPSDFYKSNMTAIPEITHFIPPRYYFSNPNLQHFTCMDQYSNTFPKGKFEILYRRNPSKFS